MVQRQKCSVFPSICLLAQMCFKIKCHKRSIKCVPFENLK